ncbi:unnamed protein product [Dimorphilus gyrociliatus]|uniref:Deacetylase sirtuin-type domain-containing protein n=1 Tax=Dimorphilus gyrociliatus TaxID=2664684 RepID=A0A7I8VA46_9ANNE|nr:unnamed protein product [Dimorphilus gyrociliatus]
MEEVEEQEKLLFNACSWIHQSQVVFIGAGAGISADSGLDLFRTPKDFWNFYPQLKPWNYYVPEMSNYNLFTKNPSLCWGYYAHRYTMYSSTEPHSGFNYLREICLLKNNNFFIYTTNIDGHFFKAGFDENKIYEPNGNIGFLQYLNKKDGDDVWPFDHLNIPKYELSTLLACEPYPVGLNMMPARPNIVLYEENNFSLKRVSQQKNKFEEYIDLVKQDDKITILEIGASGSLNGHTKPVRLITEQLVKTFKNRVKIVRINLDEYEVPNGHFGISMNAQEALKEIYYTLIRYQMNN